MSELFDVFEADPQSDDESDVSSSDEPTLEVGKKRKATDSSSNSPREIPELDKPMKETTEPSTDIPPNNSNTQNDAKRRKTGGDDVPVLTDTFETAASQQLAAPPPALAAPNETDGEVQPENLVLSHNIQHQVALPPDLGYEYIPLSEHKPPAEPARTWDFKLDPFQSIAVASIEREESVLVAAHTSAGKTVVAEYAIAQCLKRNQRVIYTSPIKALSNQKYRDFEGIFGDVGLMTGDVTINPTASCLVMTTEILRSMLYRGSEIMREVAWVVFDEVHYIREKTRGVVWEETIILLPDKVRYVFLSATIPNALQFAEWIAKIHHQACHVVYTDFRPTPLQNYFFPAGHDGVFLVVDEKRNFKEQNFNKAMSLIEQRKSSERNGPGQRGSKGKKNGRGVGGGAGAADSNADISKIVKMIIKRNFDPVIIFNFSKRECEQLALQISHFSFNNTSEQAMVRKVFSSAIENLAEADRELPQIANILPLLERGIGVHHSGLLPILKETIEILFQESLIKVLFATETFSIGLNMPAKTVVFTQVTKFDGIKQRPLTPGEYVQMSGRAGRRGLDTRGIVIMMVDESMDPDTAKQIVIGETERLNSAFYLGYNMVLNLLRIEAVSPEYMLERCFFQFQNASNVPVLEKELMAFQKERDDMVIADEAAIKDYYTLREQIYTYAQDVRWVIQHPKHCERLLTSGRLVRVYDPKSSAEVAITDGDDFGWGVVVGQIRRRPSRTGDTYPAQESLLLDILMYVSPKSSNIDGLPEGKAPLPQGVLPATSQKKRKFQRVACLLTCIKSISQIRLKLKDTDFERSSNMDYIRKQVDEVINRFPDGIPAIDPLEHMKIEDDSFKKLLRKIEVLESRLLSNPLHGSPMLSELWEKYQAKVKLAEKIKQKKKEIATAYSITQMDELKARKRVLRRLGFINDAEVVQLKARVACEISSTEGHELLLSELLFERFFNEMTPEMCAAVLSCFIFDEKVSTEPLKENLAKPYAEVVAKAKIVAKVSQESKLAGFDEEEYVAKLKWQLMDTVYMWAQGRPFAEICKMTDAYEGSLIRHFRRLEELLRQMAQAGKVMGSEELTQKFEESLNKVRRDIVAAQSLYL